MCSCAIGAPKDSLIQVRPTFSGIKYIGDAILLEVINIRQDRQIDTYHFCEKLENDFAKLLELASGPFLDLQSSIMTLNLWG